jgi:hypothetical protein
MSNIYPLLPRLTVNSRFIDEFLAAEGPYCALGLVVTAGQNPRKDAEVKCRRKTEFLTQKRG